MLEGEPSVRRWGADAGPRRLPAPQRIQVEVPPLEIAIERGRRSIAEREQPSDGGALSRAQGQRDARRMELALPEAVFDSRFARSDARDDARLGERPRGAGDEERSVFVQGDVPPVEPTVRAS